MNEPNFKDPWFLFALAFLAVGGIWGMLPTSPLNIIMMIAFFIPALDCARRAQKTYEDDIF